MKNVTTAYTYKAQVCMKRLARVRNICCKLAINLLQACSKDLSPLWRLFQKCVVRIKLDIYVFIM